MILILTGPDDVTADAVVDELSARGAVFTKFDPADFGDKASVAASFGGGASRAVIHRPDGPLDLADVRTVWWRQPGLVGGAGLTGEEWRATSDDLLDTLDRPGTLVLPGPYSVIMRAQHKMRQFGIAAELGLEIPATLVTDEPDEVLAFVARHPQSVSKRIAPGLPVTTVDGREAFRYTEVLRPVDLLNVDAVRLCPVAVQEYVPKRLELRVTVVGSRVFPAAIHSQGTHHTRDDWRRYDHANTAVEWHAEFPDEVAHRCVELTRRHGLAYGAIDLVLTPDGRYVFLEINPGGQYLWIEWLTGMPISAAIAELLIEGAD